TERAADGVLGEPGARREVALDDARAQDGCDPLGCARPREQCAVGGQGFGGQLASCGSAATVVRFEGSYNNRTTAGAARDRMWRMRSRRATARFKVDLTACCHPIGGTLRLDRVKARRVARQRWLSMGGPHERRATEVCPARMRGDRRTAG